MSPMSSELPAPDVAFAANEVAREFAGWLGHLSAERRLSPKTVEAYERDLRQFLVFLCGHLGKRVTLSALARLKPLDVRAFMAARRADGVSSRSLMRPLAGARSFARFLQRNGKGNISALSAVRSPKLTKSLPKPLAVAAAKRITDTGLRAGEEREPWILARDAAVLALLYGSGLRIGEALALKRHDIPAP
jgi:integrase/recombinase XerC